MAAGYRRSATERKREGDVKVEIEFGGIELRLKVDGWRGAVTLAGLALVGAAVARELWLPAGARTWHGRLLGVVPYDLRPPTLERLRATLWNPTDPHTLVPTAFGVGWSVNLAGLGPTLASFTARPASELALPAPS
jgi:hypothetical protein